VAGWDGLATEKGAGRGSEGNGQGAPDADPTWTEIPGAGPPEGGDRQGPSAYHFVPAPPVAAGYYPPPPPAYQPPSPQPYPPQPYPSAPYPGMPYPPAYQGPPPYPPPVYYAPTQAPYFMPFYAPGYYQPYGPARGNPLAARIGGAICMGCGVLTLVTLVVTGSGGTFFDFPFLCLALEVVAALLAIFGGLNAYQTRHYGFAVLGGIATMALAGSTLGVGFFLGLVALILVASSREAFPVQQANPFLGQGRRWA